MLFWKHGLAERMIAASLLAVNSFKTRVLHVTQAFVRTCFKVFGIAFGTSIVPGAHFHGTANDLSAALIRAGRNQLGKRRPCYVNA